MIAKQMKNRSFRSTLDYVLGKEGAELLDSNMGGTTPRQLSKEFAAARRFRPNLQRACGHIILSIPHREADHSKGFYHEHLSNERYVEIAQRWLKEMNFQSDEESHSPSPKAHSQYVIARHHDTDHEHIHIIASRIRMDGSVVPDSWDYRRSEVVVRQMEKEFGLEPTPCSSDRVADILKEQGIEASVSDRRAQTQKQKHHSSGRPPVTQLLADAIDEATADHPTMTQLIGRFQQQGIAVHPTFSTRGLFREAIAFEMDGVKVAGNKLGSAYSFPGLQKKRGVSYDSERDMPAILAAAAGEVVQMASEEKVVSTASLGEDKKRISEVPPKASPSQEQLKLADQIYPLAWSFFQRAFRQGKAQETTPGTRSLEGKNYILTYDEQSERFSISHRERKELAHYVAGKLDEAIAIQIQEQDVASFQLLQQWQQKQQVHLQKQQKRQKGLEL